MMSILGLLLSGGLIIIRHSLRPVPIVDRLSKYGVSAIRHHQGVWERAVSEVQRRAHVDETDIALCGSTPAAVAARRLVSTLVGGVFPVGILFLTSLGGASIPIHMAWMGSVVLAGAGFQLPASQIRKSARLHRRRFRTSLSAYLDLVSIMLAGGAGIETALHAAARVGDGPTFDAISQALELARATRRSPWDTLAETGSRFGVDELPELAATVRLGGEQGARMTASLVAKASALRSRELAEVEARANEATERMGLPMVLLFIGFLVLLGYPAMQLITAGFEA